MISAQLLILIFAVTGFLIFVVVYFMYLQMNKLRSDLTDKNDDVVLMEWLKEMKVSVEKNSDVLERQLKDHRESLTVELSQQRKAMDSRTKLIWERLDKTSDVIQGVQNHLGGIQEFSKDMKDLSNVLKSPKLRGGLGEQFLYEILGSLLPKDMFKTQYKFSSGSICDAVVLTEKGLIPIDSKFSMENFKLMLTQDSQEERDKTKKVFIRDVKKRIEEIASKYILPGEGTTDQAIMYIPSENVYYELITNTPEIEEYAKQKNVILASPNTLSYFVKVLLVAFQQHELQKHAGDILKALAGIKIEAEKFSDDLGVLDGHLDRASKSLSSVKLKYQRLFGRIESVQSLGDPQEEVTLLEHVDFLED
jgi:DNA recombination protein RmuC